MNINKEDIVATPLYNYKSSDNLAWIFEKYDLDIIASKPFEVHRIFTQEWEQEWEGAEPSIVREKISSVPLTKERLEEIKKHFEHLPV